MVFGWAFVVADGAPASVDPGRCAFDDPSSGQDVEADLADELLDDLKADAEDGGDVGQGAAVAAVCPGQRDVM